MAGKCLICKDRRRDGEVLCEMCFREYRRLVDSNRATHYHLFEMAARRARAAQFRRWVRKIAAARLKAELNAALEGMELAGAAARQRGQGKTP